MIKLRLAARMVLLPVLAAGCATPQPPTATPSQVPPSPIAPTIAQPSPAAPAKTVPVIFDDDGSPDGTTALLYILSHPKADLRAVGISYGETHPEIYIQHMGRLLDALGSADVPLGYGQDRPMAGSNEFPEGVRQFGNDFWGLPIPNAEKTYAAQPAPALMASIIGQAPLPVTVFVSGPATNLAQALQLDPTIRGRIAAVFMMGGAVHVPGNINDLRPEAANLVAEWNIYGDPTAAKIVIESGIPFHLIPLDATDQVLITRQEVDAWRAGGAIADQAADIYDAVLGFQGGESGMIWDLMSAAIMLEPELCGFEPLRLDVVTQDGSTSGQTVAIPGGQPNVQVCLQPDAGAIMRALQSTFTGSGAPSAAAPASPPSHATAGAPAASAETADSPARNAVDGDLETIWNAGQDAEQWILLDLGAPAALTRLRLHVSQYPAGMTVHEVWAGGDPGSLALVHEFRVPTTDGDVLEFAPPSPLQGVQFVKVLTLQSPSWVAWREIEVTAE